MDQSQAVSCQKVVKKVWLKKKIPLWNKWKTKTPFVSRYDKMIEFLGIAKRV